MELKFKKIHPSAHIPQRAHNGDAGLDLVCTFIDRTISPKFIEYGTSLAVEIPDGYVGLLFPRSSVSKTGQTLCNSVGVIDSSYRGEIKLRFYKDHPYNYKSYKLGEKIGQLIIMQYPSVQPVEVEQLSNTDRGHGSFGSTGD